MHSSQTPVENVHHNSCHESLTHKEITNWVINLNCHYLHNDNNDDDDNDDDDVVAAVVLSSSSLLSLLSLSLLMTLKEAILSFVQSTHCFSAFPKTL